MNCGLSVRQLAAPHYERLSSGIWAPSARAGPAVAGPRSELRQILKAVHQEIPDHALSHSTAALYWCFRLPRRMQSVWPVHVTNVVAGGRVRRTRMVGHRASNDLLLRGGIDGILVTGPTRTLVDVACALDATELVAVIDGIICAHRHGPRQGDHPLRTIVEIQQDLARLTGTRGVAPVRRALARARSGADSVPETRLRLMLEGHGFKGFHTDVELRGSDGYPVLPDLADPQLRISLQYDGAHHDGQGQRERDIRRQRTTIDTGWSEIRVVAADLTEHERANGMWVPRAVALVMRAARGM